LAQRLTAIADHSSSIKASLDLNVVTKRKAKTMNDKEKKPDPNPDKGKDNEHGHGIGRQPPVTTSAPKPLNELNFEFFFNTTKG